MAKKPASKKTAKKGSKRTTRKKAGGVQKMIGSGKAEGNGTLGGINTDDFIKDEQQVIAGTKGNTSKAETKTKDEKKPEIPMFREEQIPEGKLPEAFSAQVCQSLRLVAQARGKSKARMAELLLERKGINQEFADLGHEDTPEREKTALKIVTNIALYDWYKDRCKTLALKADELIEKGDQGSLFVDVPADVDEDQIV